MSELDGLKIDPEKFNSIVRLFPLPNLVMFPHIVQALHVFEPRYRELLEDALQGDRLIALGLLAPGWESDYEGRPPVRDIVCVGRVISSSRVDDGRRNVLLLGLCRARVIEELPPERSFREARVELLEDVYPESGNATRGAVQRELMDRFRRIVPKAPAAQAHLEQLLGSQVPLGVLTDLVAYSVHIPIEEKRRLLEEVDVDRRAKTLIQHVDAVLHTSAREPERSKISFPPEFSMN